MLGGINGVPHKSLEIEGDSQFFDPQIRFYTVQVDPVPQPLTMGNQGLSVEQ